MVEKMVQNIKSMQEMDPVSWSGDGKYLIVEVGDIQNRDTGILSIEDERAWIPLLSEEYTEEQAGISQDGQWMAYVSSVSGQKEVYVRPFPEVNSKRWKISNNGGLSPQWSPDGGELFYISGDSMMAVEIKSNLTFEPEKPSPLFKLGAYMVNPSVMNLHPWDIDPDGKRFPHRTIITASTFRKDAIHNLKAGFSGRAHVQSWEVTCTLRDHRPNRQGRHG